MSHLLLVTPVYHYGKLKQTPVGRWCLKMQTGHRDGSMTISVFSVTSPPYKVWLCVFFSSGKPCSFLAMPFLCPNNLRDPILTTEQNILVATWGFMISFFSPARKHCKLSAFNVNCWNGLSLASSVLAWTAVNLESSTSLE